MTMVRNEADIIHGFLAQCAELFNKTYLIDAQSTDGTNEIVKSFAYDHWPTVEYYERFTRKRYKKQMMGRYARRAFEEGADWFFCLDADEFLDLSGREELEERLNACKFNVIKMLWMNLIPSKYGTFEEFDLSQRFTYRVDGPQTSKVAISADYARAYPDFAFDEGGHNVVRSTGQNAEQEYAEFGRLFHLPVRSAERLRYRANDAREMLANEPESADHNHIKAIGKRIKGRQPTELFLTYVAETYGHGEDYYWIHADPMMGEVLLPPMARLVESGPSHSLEETQALDTLVKWEAT